MGSKSSPLGELWPRGSVCVVNYLKYKYFKYKFQKNILYFVLNTLPKSIFYNCGDGDRHVGIYASPDNWRTCL